MGRRKFSFRSLKALIPSVIVAKVRFYYENAKSFSPISYIGISLKCVRVADVRGGIRR